MDQGNDSSSFAPSVVRRVAIAAGAVLGGALISLFAASPAMADDGTATPVPPSSTTSVIGTVGGLLSGVTAPVQQVVTEVVQVLAPAPAAATPAAPAATPATPVAATATSVIPAVTAVVAPFTAAVPAPVTAAISPVTSTVQTTLVSTLGSLGSLLASRPAGGVVGPLTGALDQVVLSLPIVGSDGLGPVLLGAAPLTSLTSPVTGLVDSTLAGVGGVLPPLTDATGALLPGSSGTSLLAGIGTSAESVTAPSVALVVGAGPAIDSFSAHSAVAASSAETVSGTSAADDAPRPAGAPGADPAPAAPVSGTGGANAAVAATTTQPRIAALPAAIARTSDDDALPSSPIFATDSTPD